MSEKILEIGCLDSCMDWFLLGCPGGYKEDGAINEIGDISNFRSFPDGDGTVILLGDDHIPQAQPQFLAQLTRWLCTCRISSP